MAVMFTAIEETAKACVVCVCVCVCPDFTTFRIPNFLVTFPSSFCII